MGNKFMRKMIAVFVAAAVMLTCSVSVFAATPSTTVGAVSSIGTEVYTSDNSMEVSWSAAKNATGYTVYVNGVAYDAGTATKYVVTGLKSGTRYDVYVVAKNSKSGDEQKSSVTKRWVKATSKVTAKKSGKSIKMSWKKVSKAVKYRVVVYKNGQKWKTYNTKSLKKTLKNLKKGTYRVTVAPVYKNNYVGASKWKTVKIK